MRNKFEKLIEHIINDETEQANELFHSLVVEKSREIYNDLVAEDMSEFEMDDSDSMDATDDMMGDIAADEEGMDQDDLSDDDDDMIDHDMDDDLDDEEESGSIDMEDRVVDLEDALEELKAEFEKIMSDENDQDTEEDSEEMLDQGVVREYVEKVAALSNSEGQGVGAGTVGGSTNTKSTVAGKNDMGGTAKNLVQGGESKEGAKPKVGNMGAIDPRAAGKTAFAKKAPSAKTSEDSGVNKNSLVK